MAATAELVVVRKSVSFAELLHVKGGHSNAKPVIVPLSINNNNNDNHCKMAATEANAMMTASLPNMELSAKESLAHDLDKLSDRLGKFKPANGSRLPKPEIGPKPAHLVAQLAKHKVPSTPSSTNTAEKGKD